MRFEVVDRVIQQDYTRIGVQGDDRVETYEFILPRWSNGVDLYKGGIAYLLFSLPDGTTGYVPNLKKSVDEDDMLALTWAVGSQVTASDGFLEAELKISGLDGELWHSEITTFTVARSIPVESPQPVVLLSRAGPSPRIADMANEPPITVTERKINIPAQLQNIAVQNDEDSEEVTIVLPRYYDNRDLSIYAITLKCISEKGGRSDVAFRDMNIFEDTIELYWMLRPPQTSYDGKLSLQLHVEGIRSTGEHFQWESFGYSSVNIKPSLDAEPVVPVTPSIMDTFLAQISDIANRAKVFHDFALEYKDQAKIYADNAKASETKANASEAASKGAETSAIRAAQKAEETVDSIYYDIDGGDAFTETEIILDGGNADG